MEGDLYNILLKNTKNCQDMNEISIMIPRAFRYTLTAPFELETHQACSPRSSSEPVHLDAPHNTLLAYHMVLHGTNITPT